jgi:hypothetical protein
VKVQKINWQRVARSAMNADGYPERLLEDIRRDAGKTEWSLEDITALWTRAGACTDTWGAFTKAEAARWKL